LTITQASELVEQEENEWMDELDFYDIITQWLQDWTVPKPHLHTLTVA
jgi:hypothetical protein